MTPSSADQPPANEIEGLGLTPVRTANAPPWLQPWLRSGFEYALVEPVFDVRAEDAAPATDVSALAALATRVAGDGVTWDVVLAVSARSGWEGADVSPLQADAISMTIARGRRTGQPTALLAKPAESGPTQGSDPTRHARCVLIVLTGWPLAVLGAPHLRSRAARFGAHVRDGHADVPAVLGSAGRAHRLTRAVIVAAAAAIVVFTAVVLARQGTSVPASRADRPVHTSTEPVAGLLLPSSARSPGGRNGASAAFDALTGTVTLFGGGGIGASSAGLVSPRDTWAWDVNGWRRLATTVAPPASSDPALSYDAAHGSAILFGGIGGTATTWQWDGLAWHQLDPHHHPAGGVFASSVYDSRRHVIVLVALCCQTSVAGSHARLQTWEWRDSTWYLVPARNAPVVSRAPLITFDDARGRLLLLTQGPTAASDVTDRITASTALWSFDGMTWTRLDTPLSPPYDPIRDRFGYDPQSRQAVLFQGGDLPTWTWDDTRWHRQRAGGPLYSGAIVVDTTVDRLVLFGGAVPAENLTSVWTFGAGRWRQVAGR